MVGVPGDATQEEIEKRLLRELKGQLVGISTERTVVIDATTAALLAAKLPSDEELEETEEEKQKFSMKAPAPAPEPSATSQSASKSEPAASKGGSGVKLTRAELEAMTKDDLIGVADDHDIEVSTSWLKEDIIKAILRKQ